MLRKLALVPIVFITACRSGPDPAPQMSPEDMMAKMTELAQPGPGHARLEPMVGEFDVVGTFWMDPAAPPTQTRGRSTTKWILGGRFLHQSFSGDFMGAPFEGEGLTGFNNATGRYEGIWVDNMGTMILPVSTGTSDAGGTVLTFTRSMDDPLTGQHMTTREVITIVDRDHHTFDWYQPGPDGNEAHTMRIEYTRRK